MQMIRNSRISDIKFFAENITPLSRTSEDSAKLLPEYMTESQISVINFDAVKEAYFKSFGVAMLVSSVDALVWQNNGRWAFIEFKNGKVENEKRNIRLKIKASLLIFCDIIKENVDFTRENLDFYLIYNHENDSAQEKINNIMTNKAKEEIIRFGLSRYNKVFFNSVHTYSDIRFRNVIKDIVPISTDTTIKI